MTPPSGSRLCTRRRVVAVAVTAALAAAVPLAAYAAPLGLTSARLGTAELVPPTFHATSLVITPSNARGNALNSPSQNDVVVLELSGLVSPASVCAGAAPTAPQTWTGVTVDLVDGGTGPDLLQVVGGPADCPNPRVALITLGSGDYVAATTALPRSSVTLSHDTPTTSTLSLTLGKPTSGASAVAAATVVTATPDPALRDMAGSAVSHGTTATVAQVQF